MNININTIKYEYKSIFQNSKLKKKRKKKKIELKLHKQIIKIKLIK